MFRNFLKTSLIIFTCAPLVCLGQEEYNFTQKEHITGINSKFIEANPVISGDGRTLYFSRRYHPENTSGKADMQDVWYTELQADGLWSAPKNVGEKINSANFDAICSLSPDGSVGLFYNSQKSLQHPVAVARLEDNGKWGKPRPVKIDNYYNLNQYSDFHHSFRQNVLILAVEREDTEGEQDLYISFLKQDGSYSEPESLGEVVNTDQSDFAPFLGHDNRSLFFASYGHKGNLGGSDLYVTYRLDETWKNWSEPINLGPFINSPGDETFISVTSDFEYMYVDSHDPNDEVRDLYQVQTPLQFNPFKRPYARR